MTRPTALLMLRVSVSEALLLLLWAKSWLTAHFEVLGQPLATDVGVLKFRKLITLLIGMNCSCQRHEGERLFFQNL